MVLLILASCEENDDNINEISKQENSDTTTFDWQAINGYFPIPESHIEWIKETDYYHLEQLNGPANPLDTIAYENYTERLFITGDTLIDDKIYRTLYTEKTGFRVLYPEKDIIPYDTFYYSGAFRQNVEKQKVFFVFNGANSETVLFNFDLKLGDEINIYGVGNGIVSCVDSILINDRYHSVYYVQIGQLLDSKVLVEGIGTPGGLLDHDYYSTYNYGVDIFINREKLIYDIPLYMGICN